MYLSIQLSTKSNKYYVPQLPFITLSQYLKCHNNISYFIFSHIDYRIKMKNKTRDFVNRIT